MMISLKYIYEKKQQNYEDFASGRVLYNQKGAAAFPVRLASEIFLRSKNYLKKKGVKEPITIYDPCCGGAYILTTLGFLHGECFSKIIGSDVDKRFVFSIMTIISEKSQKIEHKKYNRIKHFTTGKRRISFLEKRG